AIAMLGVGSILVPGLDGELVYLDGEAITVLIWGGVLDRCVVALARPDQRGREVLYTLVASEGCWCGCTVPARLDQFLPSHQTAREVLEAVGDDRIPISAEDIFWAIHRGSPGLQAQMGDVNSTLDRQRGFFTSVLRPAKKGRRYIQTTGKLHDRKLMERPSAPLALLVHDPRMRRVILPLITLLPLLWRGLKGETYRVARMKGGIGFVVRVKQAMLGGIRLPLTDAVSQ
ncbi:hypothetical protein KIPB_011693, partial [Kipferlia bialata]